MLSEPELEQIENWSKKFFVNADKDYQTFDIRAEIDNKISVSENKTQLREKIKILLGEMNVEKMKKVEAEMMPDRQYEVYVQQVKQEQETQAKLEFEKVLNKIENDRTTNILEDIYRIPKAYAKMVATGHARGFLLYGQCGEGKSYCVIRAFKEVGVPFQIIQGHITSMKLFEFLYNHRKEHIIFDDVNILENKTNLNLLKACLNDTTARIVNYDSSSSKLNVPNSFLFEGTVTILINSKAKSNADLQAVESRILNYEMNLDYQTKIKVMTEIAKSDYKTLALEQRNEIVRWLRENTSEATKDFNLRKLFLIYEIYLYSQDEWKKLAKEILINDELHELVIGCLKRNASVSGAEKEFCEKTGFSGRYFYKLKKKIGC